MFQKVFKHWEMHGQNISEVMKSLIGTFVAVCCLFEIAFSRDSDAAISKPAMPFIQNGCPESFSMMNGDCVFFSPAADQRTWQDAQQRCFDLNGFLFEPRTEEDQKTLASFKGQAWIGLEQDDNQ